MARFPTANDLGWTQAAPTRPVGSFDATAIARGAEAIGKATAQLGQGVSKLGDAAGDVAQLESRWQYSKAHSDFVSRKIDLDSAIGQDQNYGPDAGGKTMVDRYTDQLNGIRAQSANMIQDPRMRDMFISHTQPNFEQGVVQAASHARALSNDAQLGYVTDMGNKAINQAVAAKTDDARTQVIDSHNQLIDGLSDSGVISSVQAARMKQDWAHQYATADVLARADTDPQGVINELRAKPGSPDAVTNRIISIEGSARNARSSATGVGQFTDGTWLDVLKRNRPDLANGKTDDQLLLLRSDKNLARDMVTAYQNENAQTLKGAGLPTTPGNLYLAHFLGPGGAKAVLQAPANMPVIDALTAAVGPDKAKAMVDANPSILQGQLAGSVKQWADGKMGGAAPGGGSIYDMLRPDVREQLLAHAQTQLQKRSVQNLSDFKGKVEDSQAEAMRTGDVKAPLKLSDFIGNLGADLGPKAYAGYTANVQLGRDVSRVATMDPQEMKQLLDSYQPKPGEGFADAAARQDTLRKAITTSLKERSDDPAGFAVTRLPGSSDAYKAYSTAAANPQATPEQRAAAARSFASTSLLEQGRAGVPALSQAILPKADVDRFNAAMEAATSSDDPKARMRLVGLVQQQKDMWGDYWPQVAAQLTPTMQPMVRAIAAGADPQAMTRLLSIDPKESPAKILKEQNETKFSDLQKELNIEMAPLMATMMPVQRDRDGKTYFDLAEKLGALYARDGKDGTTAARDAWNALIGGRYDLRDTYRIPKSSTVNPNDVQAGALFARNKLTELGAVPPRDVIPGRSNPSEEDMKIVSRDGRWVTSPRNDGLNLFYGDAPVRDGSGQPLFLPWVKLAAIGGTKEARDAATQKYVEDSFTP